MSSESTAMPSSHSAEMVETPRFADPSEVFDVTQDVLCRKWHVRIVYHLLDGGPMGFSALKDELVGVSSKMLSESLTTLEENGIVDRRIVSERPVRVEYSLTERGRALEPLVSALLHWGIEYGRAQEEP